MQSKKFLFLALVLLVISAGCISGKATGTPDKKAVLAQCLTEKGAKMYGAEWCPHCKDQKNEFGSSFKYIDYVECPQHEAECKAAGVQGYPTWIIDGAPYPGTQSLETLAKISGCAY